LVRGLTRIVPFVLFALGCDDAPASPPDAAAPREPARPAPPPRPEPPAEPRPEPRPRVVPVETASDLRSALRGATGSMSALWTLVDPERGLDVHVADEGRSRYRCRLDEGARTGDFPYLLDSGDRWSCDDALARCTSVDATDGSGYSFHFAASSGPRRLVAIVRYSGVRVPTTDTPEVATFVATSGSVCRLRAVVAAARRIAPAESAMPAELWTYRHPLQGADDDTPEGAPEERRRCGEEARRTAAALLHELGALGEPVSCDHDPLSCTYSAPFAERQLFARHDAARSPLPWAVADLASLPTATAADRQAHDVADFLRRAGAAPCGDGGE
jgi:hypothetical protein